MDKWRFWAFSWSGLEKKAGQTCMTYSESRGGSRISGKGVHIRKEVCVGEGGGGGVRFADII